MDKATLDKQQPERLGFVVDGCTSATGKTCTRRPCVCPRVPPGQSARDDREAACCGRAPGSCPMCPLIVTPGPRVPPVQSARDDSEVVYCGRAPRPCAYPDCTCYHEHDRALRSRQAATPPPGRLTTDSAERKATPVTTGVLDYFPLAVAAVARLSKRGNDKHNPGEPLHWAREKSTDHADCVGRHLIERGTVEPESGELHEACLAWRALALLEIAEEKRLADKSAGV